MFTKDLNATYMDTMYDAAEANRGKILFSYSNGSDKYARQLAESIDVTESDFPILVGFAPKSDTKIHKS